MLVLAVESQMTTLTWKSWEPLQRLPPCPWVSQESALCFHIFQQKEPWHCGLILFKMMLSLLPLLHSTSCGTLARASQPRCCALFSSPKSMGACGPHHTPSRWARRNSSLSDLQLSSLGDEINTPCHTLEGCCWD